MTTPTQQPDQPGALPGAMYTSPIPVRPTHLGHALASEWTKIRSVRSTVWTLCVFVALVVGIGLLVAWKTSGETYTDVPYTIPALFGLMLGQICLITLGVLVVTSEYGTGMIRTTFTAAPQRHRVLAAKFLVFFALAYTVSAVSITVVGLATAAINEIPSGPGENWGTSVLLGSLYVSLLGVLGLAVGSTLRHSAGAITAMLGVVLVPAIMPAFLMISPALRGIGETMLEYNAPNALSALFGTAVYDGRAGGVPQLLALLGITLVAVAGAFLLLEKRDV
ncbi:ABC transporter permease [Streptomyces albidoflavus]|uniref:ABC transporter permease n=2 Tax=Streptomyces albidoflavus TaxID=1886 RepID=UPI000BAE3E2E|nr:ABC transporter permease [Streptomyces albidoflavus]MBF4133963.1 ABC transporter permease subunit [Streptomyces albidoflavus]PAX86324.1 ABC transporter permease [Streptomyces albidoflavus]PAX92658.1 ABC transporter permease [Streptomyces albidoflavus]PBO21026.1 ABC transporter permease [Streptomyces albidoflavus]PBO28637.1 ABC transporter permease [Streptomyces albidoflavus]